jgi:hypothetical protein
MNLDVSQNTTINLVDDVSQNNINQGDAIDKIYRSMSLVINAITKENAIINEEVKKIKAELEYIKSDTDTALTSHIVDISNLHQTVMQLRETVESIKVISNQGSLLKQILDTRTMLLQTMQTNTMNIRKEITDVKRLKDEIYSNAKDIFTQHVTELNEKFDALVREQRMIMSQFVRKASLDGSKV